MKYRIPKGSREYVLVPLSESVAPYMMTKAETPSDVNAYARRFIMPQMLETETFWVIFLNTRKKILGFIKTSNGTMDTLLIHPREVFKAAIVGNAAAIVIMHNHPSGDSTPSEADIRLTRDLIKAGQLLKIEVVDHIVLGHVAEPKSWTSLRELGYFYS